MRLIDAVTGLIGFAGGVGSLFGHTGTATALFALAFIGSSRLLSTLNAQRQLAEVGLDTLKQG